MPRTGRGETGGICCHVLNRGNGRQTVFHDEADYEGFVELMGLACRRTPMRVLAWCLMPNHFHLVLWPLGDGDLARWMQWLMTSHVRRYHRRYRGGGHVWQGRYKSFPLQRRQPSRGQRAAGVIEAAGPLWTVQRYVERNPLRAGLVSRAEDWAWSSLRCSTGLEDAPDWVDRSWLDRPADWLAVVNTPESAEDLAAVRGSIIRGRPMGSESWVRRIAATLGLESSLRPRGRPRKDPKK
jgi:putative transposase